MEGLDAIKKRILADAREETHEIERQSEKVISDMMKQSQAECEKILSDAQKSAESSADVLLNRAESLTALEQRKTILGARQSLIEKVLDQTLGSLQQLSLSEKEAFYTRLIRQSGLDRGQIVLNKPDRVLGELLVKSCGGTMSVDPQPGSFAGGLIIRQNLIEENLTFETLLKNNRSKWIKLAADVLFDSKKSAGTE